MAKKTRKDVVKEEEKDGEDSAEKPSPGSGEKIPRKKRRLSAGRVSVDSTAEIKVADVVEVNSSKKKKARSSAGRVSVNSSADVKVADVVDVQSSKKKARRSPKTVTPKSIDRPADEMAVVECDDTQRIKKSEEATKKRKEKLLEGAREDAKADFAAHKKEVLGRVPEDYKNMFGQAGFAKWGKAVLPALIVSPFDVPMGDGSPRDKWLIMLDNLEQQGRLANLSYIVYWYGAKTPSEYYSFVTKSAFMDEASKDYQKHMKKLENAQAKVDSNENAPLATQETARKYKEVQEDLRKPPEERRRGGFQEGYELLSMSDVDELVSDADESGDEETGEEKVESKPAPKKKGKASKAGSAEAKKKSKKKVLKEESDETLQDDPSMKVESVDDLDDIGDTDENSEDGDHLDTKATASKAGSAKMKKQVKVKKEDNELQSGDKVMKDERPMEVGSDIGDVDEDSVDDERDDDFNEEEEEEDEKDEDFEADFKDSKKKAVKSSKKGSKAKRPTQKVAPAKKEIPKKHKAQLSAEDQRKKDIKKHQKEFASCEVKHFDTLEIWKVAIQAEDADKVSDILGGLLTEVEAIPASFIEGYQLPALMKSSKALLKKTDSKYLHIYHDVWKRMKTTYEEGKGKIPIGFKPNKRKPTTTPVTKQENPKEKKVIVTAPREKAPASAIKNEKDTEDSPSSQEVPNIPIPRRGVTAMDETVNVKKESDSKAANPPRASLPKPERKKFTLGSLMRPNSKDAVAQDVSVSAHGSGRASALTKTKLSPSWVIGSCALEVPVDGDRSMALDFLREMATHFPAGKISVETFALSLEVAIFQWASSKVNWQDDYWEKVHCLVAAIAGKRGPGSLMRFVMEGYFTAPTELVLLPDHILTDSFEGRHLRFDGRQ